MAQLIVTIDGPAASGKSTVACLLAERLGASFLDTGAMYRAVTWAALQDGIDMTDQAELLAVLDKHRFRFEQRPRGMAAFVDDTDVSEEIRQPDVTAAAKHVADSAPMRRRLVRMQREFADKAQSVVTEGRDQGTVAFADADVKFYLTADAAERARRRQAELQAKGLEANLLDIRQAIEARDTSDRSRDVGPLKPADDAIVIDTTHMDIEQVVQKVFECVQQRCGKRH